MDWLIQCDKDLFLFLNGLHSPFFDSLMWYISYKYTWIPLYAILLIVLIYKNRNYWWLILIFIAASVAASDLISVNLFKDIFCRLRPSHNPEFEGLVHLVKDYKGGSFGFVSSHAANSFAVAVFTLLLFKKWKYTVLILFWATLVSYSRIYLGVHYPADIAGGAMVGICVSLFFFFVMKRIFRKKVEMYRRNKYSV